MADRNITFALHRIHAEGSASITVNPIGGVVASTGFAADDTPLELLGFSFDVDGPLDISARYVLNGVARATIGLVPLVVTRRGRCALLYSVVGTKVER